MYDNHISLGKYRKIKMFVFDIINDDDNETDIDELDN